jgi:hypothetical protein
MKAYAAISYKLMDADSGRQDQNAQKIIRTVSILGAMIRAF